MMIIRNLIIDDLDELIKLLQQLWLDKEIDKIGVRRVIEKGLKSDYQYYICAEENNKLVGYCSLTIKNNLWTTANLGNVDELVVDSNYRNKGLGKQLMQAIEDIAKANDCKCLELDSAFHRTIAHEFYDKLGFEKRAYLFNKTI